MPRYLWDLGDEMTRCESGNHEKMRKRNGTRPNGGGYNP